MIPHWLNEDLKRWGRWSARDGPPMRSPRCPLGRIICTSDARSDELDSVRKSEEIRAEDIWPVELAVRKLEKELQNVLVARYVYLFSFYEPKLKSFFGCSTRTLYNKFDQARFLVSIQLNK